MYAINTTTSTKVFWAGWNPQLFRPIYPQWPNINPNINSFVNKRPQRNEWSVQFSNDHYDLSIPQINQIFGLYGKVSNVIRRYGQDRRVYVNYEEELHARRCAAGLLQQGYLKLKPFLKAQSPNPGPNNVPSKTPELQKTTEIPDESSISKASGEERQEKQEKHREVMKSTPEEFFQKFRGNQEENSSGGSGGEPGTPGRDVGDTGRLGDTGRESGGTGGSGGGGVLTFGDAGASGRPFEDARASGRPFGDAGASKRPFEDAGASRSPFGDAGGSLQAIERPGTAARLAEGSGTSGKILEIAGGDGQSGYSGIVQKSAGKRSDVIIEAQEVVVGNIPEAFGVFFVLHLVEKFQPICVSGMKRLAQPWMRYCIVYFKCPGDAEAAEADLDNVELAGRNLIVMRPIALAEEAGKIM